MSRWVGKKADRLFWNVFLGHSVSHRGLLGTGKGWDPPFSVKWFEAIHSYASTSP